MVAQASNNVTRGVTGEVRAVNVERREELVRMLHSHPGLLDWILPRIKKRVGKPSRKPEVASLVGTTGGACAARNLNFQPAALSMSVLGAQSCWSRALFTHGKTPRFEYVHGSALHKTGGGQRVHPNTHPSSYDQKRGLAGA
jgi:hypothetical protein